MVVMVIVMVIVMVRVKVKVKVKVIAILMMVVVMVMVMAMAMAMVMVMGTICDGISHELSSLRQYTGKVCIGINRFNSSELSFNFTHSPR